MIDRRLARSCQPPTDRPNERLMGPPSPPLLEPSRLSAARQSQEATHLHVARSSPPPPHPTCPGGALTVRSQRPLASVGRTQVAKLIPGAKFKSPPRKARLAGWQIAMIQAADSSNNQTDGPTAGQPTVKWWAPPPRDGFVQFDRRQAAAAARSASSLGRNSSRGAVNV